MPSTHTPRPDPGLRTAIGAYGPTFVPHAADMLRLLALLAVPAAWIGYGPLTALTMFLVSGGTWIMRIYSVTRAQDVAGQIALLLAGTFSTLSIYKKVPWLDNVVHFVVLMVLTMILHDLLVRHRMLPVPDSARLAVGSLLSVTGLGALMAVLWEIGEWFGHEFINEEVGVGYVDTIIDLLFGVAGALAAALWLGYSSRRRTVA
ncbi:MAG: hypothetical protein Q4P23_03095 [Micrococcaceae bacterium]|nr:hypothetical protein [Micrococcaceae bacterium]